MVHFTYEENKPEGDLVQGDLLKITTDLHAILEEFHPHYANNPDYPYLIILSQSCDLAYRNGRCDSRYITLAAVRPLDTLVEQELEKQSTSSVEMHLKIFPETKRRWFEEFIRKLINNNLPEYFYIEEEPSLGIGKSYVAYLALSIAIKAKHYKICQDARIAQLTQIFRAKLGWLVGNMYSRIATPDWVPKKLDDDNFNDKISRIVNTSAGWVNDVLFNRIKLEQERRRKDLDDKTYRLSRQEIDKIQSDYTIERNKKKEDVAQFPVKQASNVIKDIDTNKLKELEYSLINNIELEKLIS